jgi:glycosyltransferase involved in cell wall biosynthesis
MTFSKSTQKKPFFSIIIPTLNEEKYLPVLLKSLSRQSFADFEIFVVDASSQDQTQKRAIEFTTKLKNLMLITTNKKSVALQRNLGAQKAKARYLLFLDADLNFNSDYLQHLYEFVKLNQPDIFFSKTVFPPDKAGLKFMNWWWQTFYPVFLNFNRNLGVGGMLGILKSAFKKVKGYDQKLAIAEEHNLVRKARAKGFSIAFVKNACAIVSSRRVDKEGFFKFLLKYLYFIIYEHIKGPIYKPPLNYPMGGKHYD